MEHALTRALAAVGDYAEAILEIEVLGKLGDNLIDMSDDRAVVRGDLIQFGDMLLGNDEDVCGSRGRDVLEGIAELVLIDLVRGDLSLDYLAE